jgi:DNA-binding NtrC family response regulator
MFRISGMAMSDSVEKAAILVVEDSPAYQELYEEMLGTDFDLRIVGSSKEAQACLQEHSYDILLVDMRLKADERGNVGGLYVAELAFALDPSVAIVLKSGYPIETLETASRLERLHAQVLTKGSHNQVNELLDAVWRALSEQREDVAALPNKGVQE